MTKDLFNQTNYYPNRTDNMAGPKKEKRDPSDHPNQYMEISFIAADVPIIAIRDIDPYYNGVGPFTVNMRISSENALTSVVAYVSDSDEQNITSPRYNVNRIGDSNDWQLVITQEMANGWSMTADGNKYLHLEATDVLSKKSPPTFRNFIFDNEPPDVIFDRPVIITTSTVSGTMSGGAFEIYHPTHPTPKWVTGQITVGGRSEDGFGIKELWYHIGKLGDDNVAQTIREEIYTNPANWENSRLNTSTPATGWSGSPYAWTYTHDFNSYKAQTEKMQEHTGFTFAQGATDYTTTGTSRFYMPFYVKAIDSAGNFKIVHYKLCIDPDLDIPQITFNYPNEGDLVGGEVRLSGTASDNNWIHTVLVRIKKDGAAGYYLPPGAALFYTANPSFPTFEEHPTAADKDGWFKANKIGDDMVVGWYFNINGDNGLNPITGDTVGVTIEARAVDTKDPYHLIPDLVGPSAVLNVDFSTGVPTISDVKIKKTNVTDRFYFDGIRVSGEFTITMTIRDDEGIKNVKARFAGEPFRDLILNSSVHGSLPAGWKISAPKPSTEVSDRIESILEITINSTNISQYPSLGYGRTGYLNLEVQVEDNNEPTYRTSGTYNLGVDNYYPNTTITTLNNASGGAFVVGGTARDYGDGFGSIQGLERVLVYFEKAQIQYDGAVRSVIGTGDYLNPRGIPIPKTGTSAGDPFYSKTIYTGATNKITWGTSMPAMITYPNVRDTHADNAYGGVNGPNIASFGNFPLLLPVDKGGNIGESWESPHAMVIDRQELGEAVDSDEDGTFGEVWDGLVDKDWQARMDTTKFQSGPLRIHYIVMDQAGNATHYRKDIYVENNKPQIETINLGTDINGDTVVSPWTSVASPGEFMLNPYPVVSGGMYNESNNKRINSFLRIRSSRFAIRLTTLGGNGSANNYRVSYVTPAASTMAASEMQVGRVYTIETEGNTVWRNFGAPYNSEGTTFVATGPGQGSGRVTQYTEVRPNAASGTISGNLVNFTISDFTSIPDSPKTGGIITTNNARLFIVKVFDSTVSGGLEADQLAHAVLVAVDIDNNDGAPPTIAVAPFGKKYVLKSTTAGTPPMANDVNKELGNVGSYNDNIVMSGTARGGYVQYAEHSSGGRANISGMVIFHGKAEDNQRIQSITAQIPGFNGGAGQGNAFTIASWSGGTLASARTTMGTGADAWYFRILDQHLTLEYGHALNWEFAWDSSAINGVVGNNAEATFAVNDAAPVSNTNSDKTSFNIVPYITEIVTPLSVATRYNPSTFNRSANGWYPVKEDDVIEIKGFNFNGDDTNVYIDTAGGTEQQLHVLTTAPAGKSANSKTHLNVRIDDDDSNATANPINSGALRVRVGSVDSFNNTNNNEAGRVDGVVGTGYNDEPNRLNNDKLTDDRKIYVWRVGSMWTDAVEFPFLNPVMRMDSASNWYMSYGGSTTSNGELWTVINGARTEATNALNRWRHSTVAFDPRGGIFTIGANQTAGTTDWRLCYRLMRDNGTTLNNFSTVGLTAAGGDRFRIPRIATQQAGTATINNTDNRIRILLSYFDTVDNANNRLYFHYGTSWTSGGTGGTSGSTNNIAMGTAVEVANNSQTHHGSMFTAVGFLSTGRPVIAWYDRTNMNLVLSYGNGVPANTGSATVATTTAQWQSNARIVHRSAGSHVDMVIDQDDYTHLAYYDVVDGGLYYALIPPTGSGDNVIPDVSSASPIRVDTYHLAGTRLMLNVRRQGVLNVPYISYFHGSFNETNNSIRVAWRSDFSLENGKIKPGSDENDKLTGAWEIMTVPAENVPTLGELITNGVPTSGTLSGTSTSGLNGSNLARTILVGYLTSNNYEGAVLKDDILNKDF